jgi:hypothetical protein
MHYPHVVHFAGPQGSALVTGAVSYIRRSLAEGVCLAITTSERRQHMQTVLNDTAGVSRAIADGRLQWIEGESTLDRIVINDRVNADAFDLYAGGMMRKAISSSGARPVYVYGDMVDALWRRGARRAAIELEWYWNDLGTQLPFSLYCAYSLDGPSPETEHISRAHTATVNF